MKASIALIIAVVACIAARQNVLGANIEGGQEAELHEFPSVLNEGVHSCGATLIHRKWALTAAHCIPFYQIVAGDHNMVEPDTNEVNQTVAVIRNVVHPQYENPYRYSNNIALLELATELEINEYVQIATIPTLPFMPNGDTTVVGWGRTSDVGAMSNVLMKAIITIVPEDSPTMACETIYAETSQDNTMFCAGGAENVDACTGDAGGPMFCQNEIGLYTVFCGIASHSTTCGNPGQPRLYLNTAEYRGWIEGVIGTTLP